MAERLVESEPQEKVYNKITPELLLPRSKLLELRDRLHETLEWKKLEHAKYESKGIRLSIADLDVAIPFVHHMLGINGVKLRSHFTGRNKRFSTTELQLHNASSLFDLLKRGITHEEEILNSFPNSPTEEVSPFVSALSLEDQEVENVWGQFQKSSGIEDNKNFALGIHLANDSSEVNVNSGMNYYDLAGVFNFGEFPSEQGTRIQLTSRFGRLASRPYRNGELFRHNFSELKIKNDIDHVIVLQALMKDLLAGHLIGRFFNNGNLKRIAEPYVAYGIRRLFSRHSDYNFIYRHFDTTSYSITNIPVEVDSYGDEGLYFFREWLSFYSDAFNAYKGELRRYLTDGTVPEKSDVQRELPLVFHDGERTYFDLSNLPPANPKQEKKIEKTLYIVGESFSEKKCPTCGQPMKQYCQPRVDFGGDFVKIRVQSVCQGHFFSSEDMRVRKEYLKYNNPESDEKKH